MAKGQKTGGRNAGTPNRVTKAIRDRLKEVLECELDSLPELFEEVPARDRLQFIIKLIPYIIPQAGTDNHYEENKNLGFFEKVNQSILESMDSKA